MQNWGKIFMETREVKLNEWLVEGFEVFKNHLGLLLTAMLVVLILSLLTAGVLAGFLTVGLIRMVLALYDGDRSPQIGDLFRQWPRFKPAFLYSFIWGLVIMGPGYVLRMTPLLGQLLSLAYVALASSFLIFGLFLIADRDRGFGAASRESFEMVRSNLWPFMGFGVTVLVIGLIGAAFCGLGLIFTFPLSLCILGVAYREVYGGVDTGRAELVTDEKPPLEPIGKPDDEPRVWSVTEEEMEEIDGKGLDGLIKDLEKKE